MSFLNIKNTEIAQKKWNSSKLEKQKWWKEEKKRWDYSDWFSPSPFGCCVLQHLNANSCDTWCRQKNSSSRRRRISSSFYLQHIDMTAIELPARWIVWFSRQFNRYRLGITCVCCLKLLLLFWFSYSILSYLYFQFVLLYNFCYSGFGYRGQSRHPHDLVFPLVIHQSRQVRMYLSYSPIRV